MAHARTAIRPLVRCQPCLAAPQGGRPVFEFVPNRADEGKADLQGVVSPFLCHSVCCRHKDCPLGHVHQPRPTSFHLCFSSISLPHPPSSPPPLPFCAPLQVVYILDQAS